MPEFCRANRSKISQVVVADLSRLARNVTDQGTTIATLKGYGISLVSVDEPISDDTAAGKLATNIFGAMYQFSSDSLSERVRFRMKEGREAGRFLHYAPIGYRNVEYTDGGKTVKEIAPDPERAPLIRKAFELMASGRYTTGDAVLNAITGLGLVTRRGRPVTKQSLGRLLQNPIYAGWIPDGENRIRGKHEAIVSEELFQQVQDRINGKSAPHKQISEDFPLRGFARCYACGKNLTAGWARAARNAMRGTGAGLKAVGLSESAAVNWNAVRRTRRRRNTDF